MNVGWSRSARLATGAFAMVLIASACTFGGETTDEGGENGGGDGGDVTLTVWAHRTSRSTRRSATRGGV